MRRWIAVLLAGAYLLVASGASLAGYKGSPWVPEFQSPANFYQIQVDKGTPAAGVVAPIYADVHAGLPSAADNAKHARIAR